MRFNKLILALLLASFAFLNVSAQEPDKEDDSFINLLTLIVSQQGTLNSIQTANLSTLARVWGFLKYHHPRIAGGDLDWDAELVNVLPSVLEAGTTTAANSALLEWVSQVGAAQTCILCASIPTDLHLAPEIDWIHDSSLLGSELSEYLEQVYNNRFAGGNQHYVSLNAIGAQNAIFDNEPGYAEMELPDVEYRLLALFRFWNMIEYWYPYRDVIGEPWINVLQEFLEVFVDAGTRDDYARALLELIARVNDTHANLWTGLASVLPPQGDCYLPYQVRFIEDQAVVVGYGNQQTGPETGIEIGDVIQKLNGDAVNDLVDKWTPYYAASNQATRLRDIARFIMRGPCEPAVMTVLRNQDTFERSVERIPTAEMDPDVLGPQKHDLAGATFQLLDGNVAYIKLSSITVTDITDFIVIILAQAASGLIIDIRNYPNEFVVFALGNLLVTDPVEFAAFTIPDLANPGSFLWGPVVSLQPSSLLNYGGKVIVLVDETTLSQAEYTAMALRATPNASVIGSTTAGADGNVSSIPLPGGFSSAISGIGVFYPDRSPTQRLGIIPDIFVTPTIQGIREGRDEVLERALQEITN